MSGSTVFSGARCIFNVASKAVGYAINCSGTTGINYAPLKVLGSISTVEFVPTDYTIEMTANLARVVGRSRLGSAIATAGSGAPTGQGVLADPITNSPQLMPGYGSDGSNIIESGELSGTIQDRIQAISLYVITGMKASQKNWEIAAGQMVAENMNFVARFMTEENEGGAITDAAAAAAGTK